MAKNSNTEPDLSGSIVINYRSSLMIAIGLLLGMLVLSAAWMVVFWKVDQAAAIIDLTRQERPAAVAEMNFQIKEIENKIVNVHAEVAELGATLSRVTTIVDNNKVDIDASSDKLDRLGDDVDKLLTTHKRQP